MKLSFSGLKTVSGYFRTKRTWSTAPWTATATLASRSPGSSRRTIARKGLGKAWKKFRFGFVNRIGCERTSTTRTSWEPIRWVENKFKPVWLVLVFLWLELISQTAISFVFLMLFRWRGQRWQKIQVRRKDLATRWQKLTKTPQRYLWRLTMVTFSNKEATQQQV